MSTSLFSLLLKSHAFATTVQDGKQILSLLYKTIKQMKNIYNSSNTLGLKTEELYKCLLGIQGVVL